MATQTETSRSFTIPPNPAIHLNRPISRSQKKPWQSRRAPSFRSSKSQTRRDLERERLSRETLRRTTASQRRKPEWWKIRLFRGMIDDIKRRLPYYWSDWRDAWDYRVIPATVYMYFAKYDHMSARIAPSELLSFKHFSSVISFLLSLDFHHSFTCYKLSALCQVAEGLLQYNASATPAFDKYRQLDKPIAETDSRLYGGKPAYQGPSILPALAFSLDMFSKTYQSYGVNEVLLASVLGSVVFSMFAAQPLVIVGVTGPITVFNYTVYDIVVPHGISYFPFMCWIGIWSLVMHWILAITNACNGLTYVTRFSCDIFGFYVAFIYLQKGIQVLTRQWGLAGETSAFVAIMVSLLVLGFGYGCGIVGESNLLQRYVRKFIEDYGTPLTIVFFTGFVHFGHMKSVPVETLPTSKAFFPTTDRGWFIHFWNISVGDVFLAIPFAVLLTILFYFDHNVSSLIAQGSEFPLRKPPGFHWDIFLLGLTTGVAGLLGIPFPNGLIPQAPFHTNALCVTRQVTDTDETNKGKTTRIVDHVVEQRVSNLAQGLLTLGTMSGPLLVVLHLIPQGVLAGLFFVMGTQALSGNGITLKLLFLARDRHLTNPSDPLARLERRRAVWAFVALQLFGFGATFAITQTIAAIGFPIIILALIPVRSFLMPKWFRPEELSVLDAPTAGPFVMESVGGAYGANTSVDPTPVDDGTRNPSYAGSDNESAIDDTLERGESYELRSHSQMQQPEQVRRRSHSTRGRPQGVQ